MNIKMWLLWLFNPKPKDRLSFFYSMRKKGLSFFF